MFIDMQVVCRDMQIVSTDALIAFAREKVCHLSISAMFACCKVERDFEESRSQGFSAN